MTCFVATYITWYYDYLYSVSPILFLLDYKSSIVNRSLGRKFKFMKQTLFSLLFVQTQKWKSLSYIQITTSQIDSQYYF